LFILSTIMVLHNHSRLHLLSRSLLHLLSCSLSRSLPFSLPRCLRLLQSLASNLPFLPRSLHFSLPRCLRLLLSCVRSTYSPFLSSFFSSSLSLFCTSIGPSSRNSGHPNVQRGLAREPFACSYDAPAQN
jgi:hypothetical protein